MKNADFIKAHDRAKDFDWKTSYCAPSARYQMPYRIPRKTSDPFRHLVRDYCSMERDKDDRQYGAMSDVMARAKMPAKASERWTEVLKIALPLTCYAEYAAMKCTGQLVEVGCVPPEANAQFAPGTAAPAAFRDQQGAVVTGEINLVAGQFVRIAGNPIQDGELAVGAGREVRFEAERECGNGKDGRAVQTRLAEVDADPVGRVQEQPARVYAVEFGVEVVETRTHRESFIRIGCPVQPGLEEAQAVTGINIADDLGVAHVVFVELVVAVIEAVEEAGEAGDAQDAAPIGRDLQVQVIQVGAARTDTSGQIAVQLA